MKIIQFSEFQNAVNNNTNLFNSNSWLSVLSTTYGFEFKVVVDNNDRVILPFCLINDNLFPSVKSIPFGDYTLIDYEISELELALKFLVYTYPNHYIETTVVNSKKPDIENFTSTKTGSLIQISIAKWKESRDWKETYERNIRNALNYGLAVRISTSLESLYGFYELHEKLRINKFHKLPQPIRFFKNIYDEFISKEKGFLLEAWNKDILVASWVILMNKDVLYYKFGASDTKHLSLKPNDLLFRSLMQYGSDRGFKTIDLGYSGASKNYEGLIKFKSKEGGETNPIFHLEHFPERFNVDTYKGRNNQLSELSRKTINTSEIELIRNISNDNYHKFA